MLKRQTLVDQKGRKIGIVLDYSEFLRLKQIEDDYMVLKASLNPDQMTGLNLKKRDRAAGPTLRI